MERTPSIPRLITGFLLAPLVTPLFFIAIVSLTKGWAAPGNRESLLFIVLFAYLAAIVLGMPLVLALQARNKTSALFYSLGGALIGTLLPAVILFPFGLLLAVWSAPAGALSALAFWAIVFWRAKRSYQAKEPNQE